MRKITLALAALALMIGPALVRADDMSNSQTAPGAAGNSANPAAANPTGNAPGYGAPSAAAPAAATTPQVAQMAPADWTKLQGTVQAVDPASKTIQIQDTTGAVLQVPVDQQVSIKKDGSKIKLSQLQIGDTITLAKKNPTSQEKSQPMN